MKLKWPVTVHLIDGTKVDVAISMMEHMVFVDRGGSHALQSGGKRHIEQIAKKLSADGIVMGGEMKDKRTTLIPPTAILKMEWPMRFKEVNK